MIRFLVVCGFDETIATFSPSMVLRSVDFPTLGLPTIAINPVFFIFYTLSFTTSFNRKTEHLHNICLAAAHIELVVLAVYVIISEKMQH